MRTYKNLKVWQEAVSLTIQVYEASKKFPAEERFGLTSQLRKAIVSVASNVAEGAGRNTDAEFHHFLGVASGSSFESDTQLYIAKELGYITWEEYQAFEDSLNQSQKMIYGLQRRLKTT